MEKSKRKRRRRRRRRKNEGKRCIVDKEGRREREWKPWKEKKRRGKRKENLAEEEKKEGETS